MTGFLVAGTSSSVGKTTVSLILLAALRRRGLQVQPFKGGPDFLDAGHLTRVAGCTARNLDTWMVSSEANGDLFKETAQGADAVLIEGMMGLFDGKAGDSERGSSAEIAKLLKVPVVLVLDASKSARSLAAVVLGFERFDPELPLAGVVLNRVANERHFQLLQAAIAQSCQTPILGWLPRHPAIAIPERHLGLQAAEDFEGGVSAQLADLGERYLDLDRFCALTCGLQIGPRRTATAVIERVRIGVARDAAFSFLYEDNLTLLRRAGAAIVEFSPLADAALPADLDALYLCGGYPELHTQTLSANSTMVDSVRAFATSGKPVYAECGGMLYLGTSLTTSNGTYPMAGVLPLAFEMTAKLIQFGYVTVTLRSACLLGAAGLSVRGHSFHYSRVASPVSLDTSYRVDYSLSGASELEGYTLDNVLASYIHLNFRAKPQMAVNFVSTALYAQSVPA